MNKIMKKAVAFKFQLKPGHELHAISEYISLIFIIFCLNYFDKSEYGCSAIS